MCVIGLQGEHTHEVRLMVIVDVPLLTLQQRCALHEDRNASACASQDVVGNLRGGKANVSYAASSVEAPVVETLDKIVDMPGAMVHAKADEQALPVTTFASLLWSMSEVRVTPAMPLANRLFVPMTEARAVPMTTTLQVCCGRADRGTTDADHWC